MKPKRKQVRGKSAATRRKAEPRGYIMGPGGVRRPLPGPKELGFVEPGIVAFMDGVRIPNRPSGERANPKGSSRRPGPAARRQARGGRS